MRFLGLVLAVVAVLVVLQVVEVQLTFGRWSHRLRGAASPDDNNNNNNRNPSGDRFNGSGADGRGRRHDHHHHQQQQQHGVPATDYLREWAGMDDAALGRPGDKNVDDALALGKSSRHNHNSNPNSNITAAVCHPTLFGRANLEWVAHWAAYHYALGFDRVFLWYHVDVQNLTGFDELQALPFVNLELANDTSEYYYGQFRVERECFSRTARNYTWAIAIDADEFLWLSGGQNVKQFLAANDDRKYLSFGKWMYTLRYRDERNQSFFGGLNRHAFTSRSYCYGNRGSPHCPTWVGRAKVMARPEYHTHVGVHGDPSQHADSLHFHTSDAHIKEWPNMLVFDGNKTEPRLNASFVVEAGDADQAGELSIHWLFEAHELNENGSVTLHYDADLNGWLDFLASRLSTSGSAMPPCPQMALVVLTSCLVSWSWL